MGVAAAVFGPGSELAPLYDALAAAETGQAATLPLRVDKEGRTVAYRVPLEAPPRLFIAGAGHVGQALAREARILGFIVTVYDDRPEFLDAGRFPEGVRRMEGPIASALQATPLDALSYAVIVTRGHQHDLAALRAVAGRGARYVGMIGSRRKRDAIYAALRDEGVSQDTLDAVHCPIGAPIHAVTVDEIAVSIAAELTRVRREGAPAKVEGPIELD
jgi:xanthine dehydrogenase accessory factor